MYYSQYSQDYFIDKFVLKKKNKGFFIDIGAYDGITFSNSFFFEKVREWEGICFEPIDSAYKKLISARKCECINGCVSEKDGFVTFNHVDGPSEMLSGINYNYDERHMERINNEIKELGGSLTCTEVKAYNLNNIFDERGINKIDFLSIDVEGSELPILKTIDFSKVKVNAFAIENNYKICDFKELLFKYGYTSIGFLCTDEIFIYGSKRKNYLKLALYIFSLWIRIKHKLNIK